MNTELQGVCVKHRGIRNNLLFHHEAHEADEHFLESGKHEIRKWDKGLTAFPNNVLQAGVDFRSFNIPSVQNRLVWMERRDIGACALLPVNSVKHQRPA